MPFSFRFVALLRACHACACIRMQVDVDVPDEVNDLASLIATEDGRASFTEYLKQEFSVENIQFYLEVGLAWRGLRVAWCGLVWLGSVCACVWARLSVCLRRCVRVRQGREGARQRARAGRAGRAGRSSEKSLRGSEGRGGCGCGCCRAGACLSCALRSSWNIPTCLYVPASSLFTV